MLDNSSVVKSISPFLYCSNFCFLSSKVNCVDSNCIKSSSPFDSSSFFNLSNNFSLPVKPQLSSFVSSFNKLLYSSSLIPINSLALFKRTRSSSVKSSGLKYSVVNLFLILETISSLSLVRSSIILSVLTSYPSGMLASISSIAS